MDNDRRFRFLLEYAAARAVMAVFGALPPGPGRSVGRFLGRRLSAALKSRRRIARENLTLAFPDVPLEKIERWIDEGWESLGQAAYEFAHLASVGAERIRAEVSGTGIEHLRASLALGKGAILTTAHYTNWEAASYYFALEGIPLAVVARRMKNGYVNGYITRLRERYGTKVLMHKEAVRESMRWLKQGKVVGMLIDQRITAGGVTVPFFGRPAYTTVLPALLALRLECPIHPIWCEREAGGLRVVCEPALAMDGLKPVQDDIVAFTARISAVLEERIRRNPPMWLWIHNRWK